MPRRIDRPHPWRTAVLVLGALILLGIISGLVIRFAFPPYDFIDNLPNDPPRGAQ